MRFIFRIAFFSGKTAKSAFSSSSIDKNTEFEFVKNVDILIHDAQYTPKEYENRFQWGHSPFDFTVNVALQANAKKLIIFHHDPVHDDNFVDEMIFAAQKMTRAAKSNLDIIGINMNTIATRMSGN